jgi:hypothetical protein
VLYARRQRSPLSVWIKHDRPAANRSQRYLHHTDTKSAVKLRNNHLEPLGFNGRPRYTTRWYVVAPHERDYGALRATVHRPRT